MKIAPKQLAILSFFLSLPFWFVLFAQIYGMGILEWNWPMRIGSAQVLASCIPGKTGCVTPTPPWLNTAVEWLLLPNRFGLIYYALAGYVMHQSFHRSVPRTWQRRVTYGALVSAAGFVLLIGYALISTFLS